MFSLKGIVIPDYELFELVVDFTIQVIGFDNVLLVCNILDIEHLLCRIEEI